MNDGWVMALAQGYNVRILEFTLRILFVILRITSFGALIPWVYLTIKLLDTAEMG